MQRVWFVLFSLLFLLAACGGSRMVVLDPVKSRDQLKEFFTSCEYSPALSWTNAFTVEEKEKGKRIEGLGLQFNPTYSCRTPEGRESYVFLGTTILYIPVEDRTAFRKLIEIALMKTSREEITKFVENLLENAVEVKNFEGKRIKDLVYSLKEATLLVGKGSASGTVTKWKGGKLEKVVFLIPEERKKEVFKRALVDILKTPDSINSMVSYYVALEAEGDEIRRASMLAMPRLALELQLYALRVYEYNKDPELKDIVLDVIPGRTTYRTIEAASSGVHLATDLLSLLLQFEEVREEVAKLAIKSGLSATGSALASDPNASYVIGHTTGWLLGKISSYMKAEKFGDILQTLESETSRCLLAISVNTDFMGLVRGHEGNLKKVSESCLKAIEEEKDNEELRPLVLKAALRIALMGYKAKGLINHSYLPKEYYVEVLKEVEEYRKEKENEYFDVSGNYVAAFLTRVNVVKDKEMPFEVRDFYREAVRDGNLMWNIMFRTGLNPLF